MIILRELHSRVFYLVYIVDACAPICAMSYVPVIQMLVSRKRQNERPRIDSEVGHDQIGFRLEYLLIHRFLANSQTPQKFSCGPYI